jgi:multiple sugar transport system permease protein
MVLTSLKPGREVFAIPPVWFFAPTLEHYSSILSRPDLLTIVYNTVIVSSLTSIVTLLFGTMAAYSMSRFRTGGAPLLYGTLVIRILPPIVLGLPFFVLFSQLRLTDTLTGLIIAYVSFLLPTTTWLMLAFFNDIPAELEDAALVDGCSRFGAMIRVALPLARPGLVVTGIFTFMGAWNHFFYGLILASTNARTLPVEASNFVGEYAVQWGEVSAIGSLIIIPPILVVFLMQKHLVRGLTLGALKG